MTHVVFRAEAAVGWLAHAIGRVLGGAIWFAPRAIPWALVLAVLIGLAAWRSVEDARAVTARQPRPEPAGLADVVDLRATGWVGTSTIVRGPFLDSSVYGAAVQRWYYLLVDPRDSTLAMVARSPSRLEDRRTRTVVARVTHDPDAVASALAAADPEATGLDRSRYLVELDVVPPTLAGPRVVTPVSIPADDEGEVILRGEFEALRAVDGSWEYLVRERGRALVIRSPYSPSALPVDVWGVPASDRVRTRQALDVPELQAAAGERRIPDGRLLAEGVSPPLPSVSYVPAMVLAAASALLALGWLLGYPIVRRRPMPDRLRTWPLGGGEEIAAELFGTDRRGPGAVTVEGAPARIERLAADELDRRTWQYSLREATGLAPAPATSASPPRPSRLALSSGQGPILLQLEPTPAGLRIGACDVVHVRARRPGLRLRADQVDLVVAFETAVDRERAIVALDPARLAEPRSDPRPAPAAAPAPVATARDDTPMPLRAAAVVLAVVGALLLLGGLVGLPGVVADPASGLPPVLAQLVVGGGVLAVGRGVWLRRDWAASIGFTVGWIGAAAAAFLVVAAPQCGLWLSPNLAACEAAGPLGSALALAAAVGLAYAAVAVRRHAAAFVR